MKILLLGANGMLGQSIMRAARLTGMDIVGVDRSDADYAFDLQNDLRLERTIDAEKPDIVINTAAIVSLEQCEGNPGVAYCVNTRMPGVLSDICGKKGSYLIHVSTDHFYSGDGRRAHSEDEKTIIVNEYARTKLLGEELVLRNPNALVLRTNIVGFRGRGTPTFLEWAIKEIQANNTLRLFSDFFTSSISVDDFSKYLFMAIPKHPTGIYNLSSSEVTNKKEFLLELSRVLFGTNPDYVEGSVKDIVGARRADSLGLDNKKLESLIGCHMPSLSQTMHSIKMDYEDRKKKGLL